jgi:hypothetical protein
LRPNHTVPYGTVLLGWGCSRHFVPGYDQIVPPGLSCFLWASTYPKHFLFRFQKRKTRLSSQTEAGTILLRVEPYLERLSLPVAGGGVDGGGAFSQQADTPSAAAAKAAKTKYLTKFIYFFKTRFPSDFQTTNLGFGHCYTAELNRWCFHLPQLASWCLSRNCSRSSR